MTKQEIIVNTLRALQEAKHGEKAAIVRAAAAKAGVSVQTMHRWLKDGRDTVRRRRSDAGRVALDEEAAAKVAALMVYSGTRKGKMPMTAELAVETLLAAGKIDLPVDPDSGKIFVPARGAIVRALRAHGFSRDILTAPAPHTQMRSLHPNHVWEIDASVCSLFYIENGRARQVDETEAYKNKPHNLARVERGAVVRYVVVDHFSGAFHVHYALGAESAANACEALIRAMECNTAGLMHGRPLMIAADQGAAHKSAAFRNLLDSLGIKLWLHAPKNPRATGSAEVTNRIVGERFEPLLRLMDIDSVDALNAAARKWLVRYHMTRRHSRHGKTRFACWSAIRPEQLVEVDGALARELVTGRAQKCKVSDRLTVRFRGAHFDVREIPNVFVGEELSVSVNPLFADRVCVRWDDADGVRHIHHARCVQFDENHYPDSAPVWGEGYQSQPVTKADMARQKVREAAGILRDEGVLKRARRSSQPVFEEMRAGDKLFGGGIPPEKLFPAPAVTPLPRRGDATVSPEVVVQASAPETYSHFRAAQWLLERGVEITPAVHALIAAEWPQGVPENELETLKSRAQTAGGLKVMQGGNR